MANRRLLVAIGITAAVCSGTVIAQTPAPRIFEVTSVKMNKSRDEQAGSNGPQRGGHVSIVNTSLHVLLAGQFGLDSAQPTFDVASVKANPGRVGIRGHSFPGDRFEARNVPLRDLIIIAFGAAGQMLPDSEMAGGPRWIDTDRFDVSATVGNGNPASVAQKQAMLRTLLLERFTLAVHHETRDLPIYALTLAKANGQLGPKLHHADVDCEPLLAGEPSTTRQRCLAYVLTTGALLIRGQTLAGLANVFSRVLDRPVDDRTGLTGGFDADANFNPATLPGMPTPLAGAPASDAPSFNAALQDQLGLRLESTRGPVDVLVIDRVEHPTEN